MGKIVPTIIAVIGLAFATASVAILVEHGWRESSASAAFFLIIAVLTAWVVWKFVRTAWLVILTDDTFTCLATGGRWTFGPGEIVAIRGDVYHQFVQIVGTGAKISIWAQIDDRQTLFAAIRRANPMVEFAPWIQMTND